MNHFTTSTGERISKAEIDRRVRKAKAEKVQDQLNEHGFNFCEKCAIEGQPENANEMELKTLDCAHLESTDSCQKNGHAEKAFDKNNIAIMCRHHHREYDKTNLKSGK